MQWGQVIFMLHSPATLATPPAADLDAAEKPDNDPEPHGDDRHEQVKDMVRAFAAGKYHFHAPLTVFGCLLVAHCSSPEKQK